MKIISCVFPIELGKPALNAEKIINIINGNDADIYLFPAFVITGVSCGELHSYKAFADARDSAIKTLCDFTKNNKAVIVTSTDNYGNIILMNGEIIQKDTFELNGKKIVVSADITKKGDIILLPTAMAGYPCIQNDIIEYCAAASEKFNCIIAVSNPGFGESVADSVYKGFCGVFKNGLIVDFKAQETPETQIAQMDINGNSGLKYSRPNVLNEKIPYYGKNKEDRYLNELFLLQIQALYTRISTSGLKHVALNFSGGLDSTLVLLVAIEAMKMAELPQKNIIVITLPCFGTSERTLSNAQKLMKLLGTTTYEIDIKNAVTSHLQEIGHDISVDNVVYENAQARERAQILFDIANKYNAITLGTGDLSEMALGFCTYAGDTLSHYNVNSTVPKTLVRALVKFNALKSDKYSPEIAEILIDITETPISPELKTGQKTEEIVGPYDLHDFFIYYFAKYHMSPEDIKNYAMATFDEYSDDEIENALAIFFTRYPRNQFKRSSITEGANLIGFKLPYIPTELNPKFI